MASKELTATITGLLNAQGLNPGEISLSAIDGGGNNRVFAVDSDAGKFVAKAYFNDAADTRDRLGAEYAFLSYAAKLGLTIVPKPIACSVEEHVGIYEFIQGAKLGVAQLNREYVLKAAGFIANLNAGADRGEELPPASEACFDIEQHLTTVDRRLAKLQALPGQDEIDREAQTLIGELSAAWQEQRRHIAVADVPALDSSDRCISPSDFGFHNALLKDDGELCFIDFEYAGWDDPAKMAGDFFCQPAVPVPQIYFDDFISEAVSYSSRAEALRARAHLLLPASQIKWCCIMLNEFLPEAARRRQFANPTSMPEQRKRIQLDKTRQFFQSRLT
ncbi:aminoglycoside phosphotransferase family protein [Herbaspirillum rhizosphaerae]|uniref:aminoglycoside phosphotransferase family protein n=1 Tax=Herbaspirillum rhizosphaerae TaxID=346179 RepID=UPI00067B015C|nr:aminoglycoside phosphotransferase family protein [Herbaspirillum rhizosphaerae]